MREAVKANTTKGDLFVPQNAYFAMIDTIMGLPELPTIAPTESPTSTPTRADTAAPTDAPTAPATRSYAKDFAALCSETVNPNITSGCALLAFNVYGGDDRSISNFFYQPTSTPAFNNTIYNLKELRRLQKYTPTSLIQTYYSCVLAPWPALLNAVGVGFSSATVFVVVGFAVYTFMILFVMNRYFGANIPSKKQMVRYVLHSSPILIYTYE